MGSLYRIIGWVVPLLCVAGAGVVIYNRQNELLATDSKQKAAEQQFQLVVTEKAQVMAEPQDLRFAAAPAQPLEEARFIDELRKRATLNRVTIVSWTSSSATFGAREQSALTSSQFSEEEAKAISGVTRITCDLKLKGDYLALRAFIHGISGEDRLLTLNKVTWTRSQEGSDLSLSLSRYTIAEAPSIPALQTDKASSNTTGKTGNP
ncbi:MAG: hypothetical protein JSS65_06670 [Armatimonadetes bacterium]|nr:hypothetical protein [Armatimonadota bacterium]